MLSVELLAPAAQTTAVPLDPLRRATRALDAHRYPEAADLLRQQAGAAKSRYAEKLAAR